jgi:serine protease Do
VEIAEGAAARAGIRPGDVVLRLNNNDVKDVKQFNALISKLEPKKTAVLLIRRGESSQFVPVKPNGQ